MIDLDDEQQLPFDDPATFHMISQARTLGVFQIESARSARADQGIETFDHIITDISLFPAGAGREQHDHALPRGQARLVASYLHDDLHPILEQTKTASWSSTSR